jgi:large conductance mechanosensitive channel
MGLLSEFKAFALRGNVVDLAVGVIIGAAFGKIVSSFVSDIVMPPIGLVTGGVDFSDQMIVLKDAVGDTPAVAIRYGSFLTVALDFVIVAFVIFLLVRMMNNLTRKEAVAPATPPAPTPDQVLLTEIRDLLKSRPL